MEPSTTTSDNVAEPLRSQSSSTDGWFRTALGLFLGIGKTALCALTYDELLWWRFHRGVVDEWRLSAWEPCAVLQAADLHTWDIFQVLTFVGTNGCFVAERRGAVTHDGYLLICHKIRRVPPEIQKQLANPRYFTITTYLTLSLMAFLKPLLRGVAELLRLPRFSPSSPWGGDVSSKPQAVVEVPAVPTRVQTKQEVLLPIASTHATGSTVNILQHTPCRMAESERLFTSPTPYGRPESLNVAARALGESVNSECLGHRRQSERVVIFQHGLLESSVTYMVSLWASGPSEGMKTVPWRLLTLLTLPVYVAWRCSRQLSRQVTCILPNYQDRECETRLKHSLPINVMLKDPTVEVWLTNTRGNDFSCNLHKLQTSQFPPVGHQPLEFGAYKRIFSIYAQEHWTYVDSAVLDCEGIYNMLFRYYRTTQLAVTAVAFSQGCAVYSLNAAMKAQARRKAEVFALEDLELASPSNFPLLSPVRTETLSAPQTEEAGAIITPVADLAVADPTSVAQSGWTSGIYSDPEEWDGDFDRSLNNHIHGSCCGIRYGCSFCNLQPVHMVMLAPPLMLKFIDGPHITRNWGGRIKKFFCKAAWSHLQYLVCFVTFIQSLLYVRCGLIGQAFVKYFLGFGIRPLHSSVADLAYKFIPSGITTYENMLLWNKQMHGFSVLGTHLSYLPSTRNFFKTIWKISAPSSLDISSHLPCTASVYAGMQDNIADTMSGASRLVNDGYAFLRLVNLPENVISYSLPQSAKNSKIAINLIAESSHLDIVWPSNSVAKIQGLIVDDILSLAGESTQQ